MTAHEVRLPAGTLSEGSDRSGGPGGCDWHTSAGSVAALKGPERSPSCPRVWIVRVQLGQ